MTLGIYYLEKFDWENMFVALNDTMTGSAVHTSGRKLRNCWYFEISSKN